MTPKVFTGFFVLLILLAFSGCGDQPDKGSPKITLDNQNKLEEAEKRFKLGIEYFNKGKYEHALSNYLAGLKLNPESAVGYNLLGMVYRYKFHQTGNYQYREKEIKAFRKCLEMQPMFLPAVKNLGATLMETDQKAEAANLFKRALRLNPEDPEKELMVKLIKSVESR